MISFPKKTTERKSPQDLLALDFGSSGLKVVRFKRINGVLTLAAADILPAIELDTTTEEHKASHLSLPKPLLANYAAVAYTGERALIRVVSVPGQVEDSEAMEQTLREHIGLDKSFRLSYLAPPGTKGRESRVLAAALPENDLKAVLAKLAVGAPAPHSFELSGLAAMNGCLLGPAKQSDSEAICVIDSGAHVSVMTIFNKGVLVLARKLEVGGQAVIAHIQKQFGVDADMAQSILMEGAFDIASSIKHVIDPFVRQLTISRDFVERQENCRITSLFMSGGMCLNAGWVKEIARAANLQVRMWNPFDGLAQSPGAFPDRLRGQECRFAAAIGAAMGAMQTP